MWQIKQTSRVSLKNPILIEGLPGMGNVGKIAVDYLIDALGAEKIFEMTSNELPHCVFINEENLVELPAIEIYHTRIKNRSLLLLAGDIQPMTESSCYEFCHAVLDAFQKSKGKEIISLGGIGLQRVPKEPKVYATANSKNLLDKYATYDTETNLRHVVGPIVGVSGLLTGLAGKRNIPATTLLAETLGHPNFLGIKGAKNLLEVIKKHLKLNINLENLEEEAANFEQEIGKKQLLSPQSKKKPNFGLSFKPPTGQPPTALPPGRITDYIG